MSHVPFLYILCSSDFSCPATERTKSVGVNGILSLRAEVDLGGNIIKRLSLQQQRQQQQQLPVQKHLQKKLMVSRTDRQIDMMTVEINVYCNNRRVRRKQGRN